MYNKVILIGNLTRDIELRYLPSGQALAKSAIATNRRFKDSTGMQKDEAMFIDITIWGRAAEIANQYLRKGSRVLIEGRLTLEQWTDMNGQRRSKHSVTVENLKMLDRKGENEGFSRHPTQIGDAQSSTENYGHQQSSYNQPSITLNQQQAPKQQQSVQELPTIDIDEDDIPF